MSNLLRSVARMEVPAATRFVASEHFRLGTSAGPHFGLMDETFKRLFLPKVEESVPARTLIAYDLELNSRESPILKELGEHAETTLAHLFFLLSKQPGGEEGILLVHRNANAFHIRGVDGNLWVVQAGFVFKGEWGLYVEPTWASDEWIAGIRFFSGA